MALHSGGRHAALNDPLAFTVGNIRLTIKPASHQARFVTGVSLNHVLVISGVNITSVRYKIRTRREWVEKFESLARHYMPST